MSKFHSIRCRPGVIGTTVNAIYSHRPRRRAAREQPVEELAQDRGPPRGLIGYEPEKREQAPLVEALDGQSAERGRAAPKGVDPHPRPKTLHGHDLPLEKSLRGLRERREEVGDDGRFGGQGPESLAVRNQGRQRFFDAFRPACGHVPAPLPVALGGNGRRRSSSAATECAKATSSSITTVGSSS